MDNGSCRACARCDLGEYQVTHGRTGAAFQLQTFGTPQCDAPAIRIAQPATVLLALSEQRILSLNETALDERRIGGTESIEAAHVELLIEYSVNGSLSREVAALS